MMPNINLTCCQKHPKMVPKTSQDPPTWSQDGPKTPKLDPRCVQDPQLGAKMAPRHPKLEPRWPQERPSRAKMRPRCFQDGLPRVQVQYQRSGHAAATYPAGVATGRPLIVGRSKAPQVAQLSLNLASTWLNLPPIFNFLMDSHQLVIAFPRFS